MLESTTEFERHSGAERTARNCAAVAYAGVSLKVQYLIENSELQLPIGGADTVSLTAQK